MVVERAMLEKAKRSVIRTDPTQPLEFINFSGLKQVLPPGAIRLYN